nr:hypothetical protein [Mesorhizobium sp.]
MDPKLVAKPPGGEDWIHEIKLDGYRSQIVINSPEDIRVFTKTGADWTGKYAGLVEAARELEVENAIIDGEAVPIGHAGQGDPAQHARQGGMQLRQRALLPFSRPDDGLWRRCRPAVTQVRHRRSRSPRSMCIPSTFPSD